MSTRIIRRSDRLKMGRSRGKAATQAAPAEEPTGRSKKEWRSAYKLVDEQMMSFFPRGMDLENARVKYAVGQTYKMKGRVMLCGRGYHSSFSPLDCAKVLTATLDSSELIGARLLKVTIRVDGKHFVGDTKKTATDEMKIDREVKGAEFNQLGTGWKPDDPECDGGTYFFKFQQAITVFPEWERRGKVWADELIFPGLKGRLFASPALAIDALKPGLARFEADNALPLPPGWTQFAPTKWVFKGRGLTLVYEVKVLDADGCLMPGGTRVKSLKEANDFVCGATDAQIRCWLDLEPRLANALPAK